MARKLKILLSILLAIALFYPLDSVVIPEWKVQHVDAMDRPIADMKVRQWWHNNSTEGNAPFHTEDAISDRNGITIFPEHRLRSPVIIRLLGPVFNFLGTGIEASYGPSSWIDSYCDVSERGSTRAVYSGHGLQPKIIYYYIKLPYIHAQLKPTPSECSDIERQVIEADKVKPPKS